jgi:hypothetical protein
MSETGLMVPDVNEPLSRYDVTVTVRCDGRSPPDPAAFVAAADQAAWSRSASIMSAHLADKIISIVTVTAPDRYAAKAVARAVVSNALKRQALSPRQSDNGPLSLLSIDRERVAREGTAGTRRFVTDGDSSTCACTRSSLPICTDP